MSKWIGIAFLVAGGSIAAYMLFFRRKKMWGVVPIPEKYIPPQSGRCLPEYTWEEPYCIFK